MTLGQEHIDLRYVEQLADSEQLECLGYMMKYAEEQLMDGKTGIRQIVDTIYERIRRDGLEILTGQGALPGNLCIPRKQELFACMNRYRGLRL